MSSSGLLEPEFIEMMSSTIEVSTGFEEDLYGKRVASGWRTVKCYIVPGTDVTRTHEVTEANPSQVAYCDDVDISSGDLARVDGDEQEIKTIETYNDEEGRKVFQVVGLG